MKNRPPLIVDAHEDIAYNLLTFGRDYTRSALEIRQSELGSPAPLYTDEATLGWPEYQRGRVAVVFSTLFVIPMGNRTGEWDTQAYADASQANRLYRKQVEAYDRLTSEHPDLYRLIHNQQDLQEVLAGWESEDEAQPGAEAQPAVRRPVGLVQLMEGAEGVRSPGELEEWWQMGVRIIGPAWMGTRFCGGTRQPGPLTSEGYALLEGMAESGFGLDLSHMDENAALQALDVYPRTVLASHSNALALLKESESNRHLSDRLIQGLLERDGVIGIVPFNAFLQAGWRRGDRRDRIGLNRVVAQLDYICQMAGNARHVGIGSDFDGGFGLQSLPVEMDTVADLQKIAPLLEEKGYSAEDISAIMGGNWLSLLRRILP